MAHRAPKYHWRLFRGLHALDALVLDYQYPSVTRWIARHWPRGWSHECPGWAIRRYALRQQRKQRR